MSIKPRNRIRRTERVERFKGEIIIDRRLNLDFTLELQDVLKGLHKGIPDFPYKKRVEHYNKKLNKVWIEKGLNYERD